MHSDCGTNFNFNSVEQFTRSTEYQKSCDEYLTARNIKWHSPLNELKIADDVAPIGIDPSDLSDNEVVEENQEQEEPIVAQNQLWMKRLSERSTYILEKAPWLVPLDKNIFLTNDKVT